MLLGEELDGLQVVEQIQEMFPRQKAIIVSGTRPTTAPTGPSSAG